MKFAIVLNGCSQTYRSQAEEMYGFLKTSFLTEGAGETFVVYDNEKQRDEIIRYAPTPSLHLIKMERYQPEAILHFFEFYEGLKEFKYLLFPSDFAGQELAVRLGSRLKGSSMVAVEEIDVVEDGLICSKLVYGNHLRGYFKLDFPPFCISLQKGGKDPCPIPEMNNRQIHHYEQTSDRDSFIQTYLFKRIEKDEGLESASFVIIGGYGLGSREAALNLQIIVAKLNAGFGVTRPVAMNGWVDMGKMVGVSGELIKPKLCLVLGASGSAAFMAGIKKSEFIVAVNQDAKAPIMKQCDVAVIDDYVPVMDALIKLIKTSQPDVESKGTSE
jgi:electron transfer flavoprotein alpha subunit